MTNIQIEFHGTPNRDQIEKACKRYLSKEVTKIECEVKHIQISSDQNSVCWNRSNMSLDPNGNVDVNAEM